MTSQRTAAEWRALDAPFTQAGWQPIPGHCSRCGQPAWLGETKWWHDGAACRHDWRTAEFLPD